MLRHERSILEACDAAVTSVAAAIEPIVVAVEHKLEQRPLDNLAWEVIPLDLFSNLPEVIRSSWVFVLRANAKTGAEWHPNSHQRMMSFRGRGDFQTRPEGKWVSHQLSSDPARSLGKRWISIPRGVWHQGLVGPENWAVVSFHTVPASELVEERPAKEEGGPPSQRKYVDG